MLLTGMKTDPGADSRKRVSLPVEPEGLAVTPFTYQRDKSGYIHRRRTGALTGRPDKTGADPGLAVAPQDMVLILPAEVTDRRQHRIGSRLSQSAEGGIFYNISQVHKGIDITFPALAPGNPFQDLQHPLCSHPAGDAFAAGLLLNKFQEKPCHIHHAALIIHYNQTAGTHYGSQLLKVIVVQRNTKILQGDAAPRGPSDLGGLVGFSSLDAAAHFKDKISQGRSDGDLHKPCISDGSRQGKDLCSLAVFSTERGVPVGTL